MRNCETELWQTCPAGSMMPPTHCQVWSHWLIQTLASSIDVLFTDLVRLSFPSESRSMNIFFVWTSNADQPTLSVIWPLTIKMKMRSVASVNLLNVSVQDDMGFLGLWSWRNFSDETEWAIIKPTILSNQQSCHIRIRNDEWYTEIKICVFFWYNFLVISQSWRGALVGCWSGTGPAFALGWFMRQQ